MFFSYLSEIGEVGGEAKANHLVVTDQARSDRMSSCFDVSMTDAPFCL